MSTHFYSSLLTFWQIFSQIDLVLTNFVSQVENFNSRLEALEKRSADFHSFLVSFEEEVAGRTCLQFCREGTLF